MLRSKDLNLEIEKLEKNITDGVVSSADVLKALCLLVKVARDIRTNQVVVMKSQGIKLVEPNIKKEE